jgi:MFS family permease
MSAPAAELDSRRAWGVCAAAFAAMFVAFGIAYSYGAYLEELREEFDAGRAVGAVFFSLTSLLFFGLGAVTGPALDRHGPRRVLLVGAAFLGVGLVVTAAAQSIAVALVAYSLGVGVAVACAYVPMVALVGGWFEERRTLALGVAVAGIGLGTLITPPVTAALIEEIGWRDSYRLAAVVGVVVLLGAAWAVAPAPVAAGTGHASLREALRDGGYRWLYASTVLISLTLFVPFVHLPDYAEERGVDEVAAAALVGVIGIASVAGRLVLGAVAGSGGLLRVYQACFLLMGSSFAIWLVAGSSYAVMVCFGALLGVGYGGFVALAPAVVAARFGVGNLGALLGVLYTGAAIGSAVGPPVAGAIIDGAGYHAAIVVALVVGLSSVATIAPVTLIRSVRDTN